jgi:hypothetical protein
MLLPQVRRVSLSPPRPSLPQRPWIPKHPLGLWIRVQSPLNCLFRVCLFQPEDPPSALVDCRRGVRHALPHYPLCKTATWVSLQIRQTSHLDGCHSGRPFRRNWSGVTDQCWQIFCHIWRFREPGPELGQVKALPCGLWRYKCRAFSRWAGLLPSTQAFPRLLWDFFPPCYWAGVHGGRRGGMDTKRVSAHAARGKALQCD